MATQKHLVRRLLMEIIGLVIAAGIIFAILAPSRRVVRLECTTNGVPTLSGISLSNTNFRNAVFKVIHFFGGRAELVSFSDIFTNTTARKNMGDAYSAMKRAGISTETPAYIQTDIRSRLVILVIVILIAIVTAFFVRRRTSKVSKRPGS